VNLSYALLVCLCFFLVFFSLSYNDVIDPEFGLDGKEHKAMASNPEHKPSYPPLLRTIGAPFTAYPGMWHFFTLFLFAIMTPLAVAFVSKNWLGSWFYFSLTFYPYYVLSGYHAQGLAFLFILFLFCTKNNWVRLGLVLVGSLSHSMAPLVLPLTLALLIFEENFFPKIIARVRGVGWLPVCLPFVSRASEESSCNGQVAGSVAEPANKLLPQAGFITAKSFLFFSVKVIGFPFLFAGLVELAKRGKITILVLMALSFFSAWFLSGGVRAWYLVGLLGVVGFSMVWERLPFKKIWMGLSVAWFLIMMLFWFAEMFRWTC